MKLDYPSNKKILSFCIATYNQPNEVENILLTLSKTQCDIYLFEIIIKDDSNNNLTNTVVSKYINFLPIKYFQGQRNGIDKAFLFLVEQSCAKFIWLFGDDIITTETLPFVINFLCSNPDIDLLYINSGDIKNKDALSIFLKNDMMQVTKSNFLSIIKDQLGFCSAIVMNQSLLKNNISDATKFIGTAWVNLFLALKILACGNRFAIIAKPLFFSKEKPPGEVRWYDSYQVHAINFFDVTNYFVGCFEKNVIKSLQRYKFSISWRAVIYERAMGFNTGFASKSPKVVNTIRKYWWASDFLIAIILLLSPKFFVRLLYISRSKLLSYYS